MKYSEDTLMAFVDGELDTDLRAQIEAAVTEDPELARRVAAHLNLRGRLRSAYAAELDGAPPQRLLDTLAAPAPTAHARDSNVVKLDRLRGRKIPHTGARQWSALAASLVIGVGVGYIAFRTTSRAPVTTEHGALVANAALGQLLSEALAGGQAGATGTRIGISYRSRSGDLCRSFVESGLAGIACHSGEQWRIRLLTQAPTADTTPYRAASSELPPLIRQGIDADIDGDPFDAQAERDARARGWRAK